MNTLGALAADRGTRLGHAPALTFHDGVTGERTELSYATLHNWVSKAANLLVDEWSVGPGSVVGLRCGDHWAAAVVAMAAWRAGAGVALTGGRLDDGPDVAVTLVCEDERASGAGTGIRPGTDGGALVVGTGFGGRLTSPRPAGAAGTEGEPHPGAAVSFGEDVPGCPDEFDDVAADPADDALADGTDVRSHREVLADAEARVRDLGLGDGARIALVERLSTPIGASVLVATLLTRGTLLLLRQVQPDAAWRIVESERAAVIVAGAEHLAGLEAQRPATPNGTVWLVSGR